MAEPDAEFQKQIRAAFDNLTDEQKRNVLMWGNPNGLAGGVSNEARAAISFPKTDFPALHELQRIKGTLQENADVNRAYFGMQMANTPSHQAGLMVDPYWKPYPTSDYQGVDVAAGMNSDAVDALATQLSRLEPLYPGITSRLQNYLIGQPPREVGALAWFRPVVPKLGNPPGLLDYEIGSPAQATFLRRITGSTYRPGKGDLLTRATPASQGDWHSTNAAEYGSQLDATMAHELGHATQHTMKDFVRGLPEGSDAAKRFDYLTNILGTAGPGNQAISGYAADASRNAMMTNRGTFRASEEPFAELFAAARSPQGLDIQSPNLGVRRAAINDIVGTRTPRQAETLLDRVGLLNETEKSLRNEGFSEVGAVAPELAMQIGLPALAGLLASKTHGNVRSALSGAAVGAGLGSLAGPEGTVIGGALGAGASLARQLL